MMMFFLQMQVEGDSRGVFVGALVVGTDEILGQVGSALGVFPFGPILLEFLD